MEQDYFQTLDFVVSFLQSQGFHRSHQELLSQLALAEYNRSEHEGESPSQSRVPEDVDDDTSSVETGGKPAPADDEGWLGFSGSAIGAPSSSSINSALGSAAAGPSALSSSEFARDHVIVSAPSGHGRLSAAGGSGTSGTAQQSVERTSLPGSQQQPLRKVHKPLWDSAVDEYENHDDPGYVRKDVVGQQRFIELELELGDDDGSERNYFMHPPGEQLHYDSEEQEDESELSASDLEGTDPHDPHNSGRSGRPSGTHDRSIEPRTKGAPTPGTSTTHDEAWDMGPQDIKFAEPVSTPSKSPEKPSPEEVRPVLSRVESLSSSFKDFEMERGEAEDGSQLPWSSKVSEAEYTSEPEVINFPLPAAGQAVGLEDVEFLRLGREHSRASSLDVGASSVNLSVLSAETASKKEKALCGSSKKDKAAHGASRMGPLGSKDGAAKESGGAAPMLGGFSFPVTTPTLPAEEPDSKLFRSWPSVRSSCTSEPHAHSDDDNLAEYADEDYSRSKLSSRSTSVINTNLLFSSSSNALANAVSAAVAAKRIDHTSAPSSPKQFSPVHTPGAYGLGQDTSAAAAPSVPGLSDGGGVITTTGRSTSEEPLPLLLQPLQPSASQGAESSSTASPAAGLPAVSRDGQAAAADTQEAEQAGIDAEVSALAAAHEAAPTEPSPTAPEGASPAPGSAATESASVDVDTPTAAVRSAPGSIGRTWEQRDASLDKPSLLLPEIGSTRASPSSGPVAHMIAVRSNSHDNSHDTDVHSGELAEGEAEGDSFHEARSASLSDVVDTGLGDLNGVLGLDDDDDDDDDEEVGTLGSSGLGGGECDSESLDDEGHELAIRAFSGAEAEHSQALSDASHVLPRYTLNDKGGIVYDYDPDYLDSRYEVFELRVIHRRQRTGFEETKDFPIRLNDLIAGRYQVTDFLGSAAFSKAVQALDVKTGELVCLKIIKNNKDYFDQSLDEIKLLKYVNSMDPNDEFAVVRLHDFFYYKEHLFLVCELLRANLYEFQKYNRESGDEPYFTSARIQRIARQVLRSLAFLHSLGLIHSDLKPENILVKSYSRCEVKVIDLGSSCFVTDQLSSYVQSRSYRAPEVILGLPYDTKVDVWSLGCILAELSSGFVLFQNDSLASLLARLEGILGPLPEWMLSRGRYTHRFYTRAGALYERSSTTQRYEVLVPKRTSLRHRVPDADEGLLDFVAYLLCVDPRKRPSAAEALEHPWLHYQYPEPVAQD